MNLWVADPSDIRWSINDLYMTLAMLGWMFFFMGLYDRRIGVSLFGLVFVVLAFVAIRTQFLVRPQQYFLGMIPHHSMAVHMSQKLLDKGDLTEDQTHFLERLIHTQKEEIRLMKGWLKGRNGHGGI
jgi:hypothetical protein